jgi:uncharacterized protein with beta-barrel porin domain
VVSVVSVARRAAEPRRILRLPGATALAASTALSAAALAMLLGDPRAALAACTVTAAPNAVTCAADTTTTNTTNTDAGTSPSSDRIQLFTAGGAVTATVNNGVTIDGAGLQIQSSEAGSAITLTHNGTATNSVVTNDGSGINVGAIDLRSSGGTITYSGNGSASNNITTTPFTLGLQMDAGGGNISANTGTGSFTGIVGVGAQTSGAGTIGVTTNGTITGQQAGGPGIYTEAQNGLITITVNGGTVSAVDGPGINARIPGGSGSILINANGGSISGGSAIQARTSTGNVTVNVAGSAVSSASTAVNAVSTGDGNVIVNVTGGSVTNSGVGGFAIATAARGTGTIDVTVGAGTTVSSTSGTGLDMGVTFGSGTGAHTATVLGTLSSGGLAAWYQGTLNVGNGGTTGTLIGDVRMNDAASVLKFNRSDAYSYDGAIGQTGNVLGSVQILGGGTATFNGTSRYTGTTTVTGSGLIVNGAITQTSALNTTGTSTLGVGASGSINVTGNLVLSATGSYAAMGSATFGTTTVAGTTSLDGRLIVVASAGARAGTYTLLTANGGFVAGKETFATTEFQLSPAVRNPVVTYDATHVFLTLAPGTIVVPAGAGANQANVANGINNAILGGATPTDAFGTLLGLTGTQLTNALSQASGVSTGGVTQGATQLMTSFLTTVLSPSSGGGPNGGAPGALGFAREIGLGDWALSPVAAQAYAAVTPKDRQMDRQRPRSELVPAYAPGITMWGQAYGGYNKIDGDAGAGTNDTTARTYGLATGFDYRVRYDLVLGFAIAGGSTNWGLSQNLGGGKSDVFQVGFYAVKKLGAGYVSGAVSYAFHDVTTDRTVTIAGSDRLQSQFNAHSFGARAEAGHRIATPVAGVTPYLALQIQTFHTPGTSETAIAGANTFALTYDSRTATVARLELGTWFDRQFALKGGDALALRARVAWANDHSSGGAIAALFQTLPGSSFSVNGAKPAENSALLSAAADYRLANRVTVGARLDSEFSSNSQTYAGTGRVSYAW